MSRSALPWLVLGMTLLAGCQDAGIPDLDRQLDALRGKPAGRIS